MRTVIVVGVGALGSHVIQFLRNAEVTLRVIDDDRVEQRNVMAQFHGKPHVGKSKVLSLQQTMNMFFGRKIDVIPHRLVKDNAKALLSGDLVIDCLDNGPSRRIIQEFVRSTSTPCLHGALAADGAFGSVLWDEHFVIDEASPGAKTCEEGEHLPFICIAAAYLANSAREFLKTGRKVGFNVHPSGVIKIS